VLTQNYSIPKLRDLFFTKGYSFSAILPTTNIFPSPPIYHLPFASDSIYMYTLQLASLKIEALNKMQLAAIEA
jgi:hypothetical protein